jgi:transaldolase
VSVFAGRVADTGRDPLPMMTAAVEMVRTFHGIELGEPAGIAECRSGGSDGCDIITVTSDILKKLDLMGRDLADYSLDIVKMFYNDACSSGYSL